MPKRNRSALEICAVITSGDEAGVDIILADSRSKHRQENLEYMFHLAVVHEKPALVTKLAHLGANVNGTGFFCPLAALRTMSCTMLRHLLSLGANPNHVCAPVRHNSIADHAMLDGTREQIEILIDAGLSLSGVNTYAVHRALCQEDALWRMDIMEQHGVDFRNAVYSDGVTTAHSALGAKHPREVLELLDARGVDLDAEDRFGMTPLMHSAACLQLDAFRTLVRMGFTGSLRKTMELPLCHGMGATGETVLSYLLIRFEDDIYNKHPREKDLREILYRDLGLARGCLEMWRDQVIQLIVVNRIRRAMEEREMLRGTHLPGGAEHDAAVASMPWMEVENEM